MSQNTEADKAAPPEVTWENFLSETPPGRSYTISDPLLSGESMYTPETVLFLFCESAPCEKKCYFDRAQSEIQVLPTGKRVFVEYRCRHRKKTARIYAVTLCIREWKLYAAKLGEWPPYGPHTPTKVNALIGEDRNHFFNGRRSEALGMGIGALIYYRRVVENQKNRIIDEVIKVCKVLDAGRAILGELEQAKKETRFTAAIDKIKAAIPEILRIKGHNPLTLLHAALSQAVHDKTDAECLEIAMSIRTILGELAERLSLALKEESDLTSAVSNLIKLKSATGSKGQKNIMAAGQSPADTSAVN